MKKVVFIFCIIILTYQNVFSQSAAPSLSVIATPNSKMGWIYFKNPNTVDPNTVFTVYANNFGLGADDQMQFVKNETDELGITHTYYNHYYKNIKIDVGQNTAHSRNGKSHLVTGKICTGLNMSVNPTVSAASAITYAKNYVNATTYMWEDSLAEQNLKIQRNDVTATYYPSPELLITMNGTDLPFIPSNFKLAYKVDIYSKVPYDVKAIYIDAASGAIIKDASLRHGATPNTCVPTLATTLYSGQQVIQAYYTANPANGNLFEYKLENPCKGGGVITKNNLTSSQLDVYSPSSSWNPVSNAPELTQLHWATNRYYDFLLSTYNRQSIDNNNMPLVSLLSSNGPEYNPIYNLLEMPTNYCTNDLIGHEWGHGITKYSLAGGLPTSGEAACISEGLSDVFGTLFEFYLEGANADWQIGEDYIYNPYVRDMSNPQSKYQADTYKGINYDPSNANTYRNSGVLGYWFYLLSIGGSGTNSSPDPRPAYYHRSYNISGIGMSQPAQILYRAYPYLTNSLNFSDLRNATIQAATDLYGTNCNAIDVVSNAWDAVGVYDQGGIYNPSQPNCFPICVLKNDITCNNNLGSASITIIGNSTYNISWFNSATNQVGTGVSANSLPADNYFVIVQDNTDANCQSFYYFTIYDYSLINLTFNTTNATCIDGSASVLASGGAYPYSYSWNLTSLGLPAATNAHVDNLPAGTYNVTVTDANGCQASGSAVITQNPITFYKPYNYHVTGTETWNQSLIKLDGVVYVDNGATLNINGNTRVEVSHHADILDPMPYGMARIIVLPGGTLNVASTVILTGCGGGKWDGIELWGTGIFNTNAANATINGKIENADIGVLTDRRPKKNQAIVNAYGGKFSINGAQFTNNKIGVKIPKSINNYPYSILNSNFNIDGTSYYKNDFSIVNNNEPMHVFAGENSNLTTSSNIFTGGDAFYTSDLKGTGIKCIDCNLNVNNAGSSTTSFIGLTKGVDAEYVYTTNQVVVDGATFNNNQEAIYLQGSTYGVVKNNTFNVPAPLAPITKSYGLFAVNSSGFKIEHNTINPSGANASSYGIVIEQSASNGGEIFSNIFNGVGIGLQAQKDNSNLKIGCNNFNNPILYSMAIVNMSGFPISSLKWQGKYSVGAKDCSSSSNPAGNEWNYTGCSSGTDKNIFTSNVSFNYETHSNLNTQPICTSTPWFNGNVLPYICGISKDPNSCISIFPLPPPPPSTSYSNYYTAIKNLISNYQNQIYVLTPLYKNALATQDGGNTKNLLDAINLNPKKSAGQLKNLLNAQGALSDAVLLALINRSPALPPGTLKDILASQIPLSFEVLTALEKLNLPAGIKNTIYAAQSNTPVYTKADALLGTIKNIQGDIILLQNELQRTKLQETKSISKAELKTLTDASSKMLLAQNYATLNQTDSTRLILNQLSADTTLTITEKQNFISYMNTMVDMLDSNQTVYTADSLLMSSIAPISTSNTKVSAHANAALKERKKPHHQYFIADIPANTNQRMANGIADENADEKIQLANTGNFSLYPNPNTGSFKIELKDANDTESLITITITNLLGQTIVTKIVSSNTAVIDIQDERLFAGVYIVTLTKENKTIGQSKIIID